MHALLRLSRIIDRMNERIGKAVAWLGLAAVIVCTGNAVARYVLNIGSNAWLELQWYFNSAVFLLIAFGGILTSATLWDVFQSNYVFKVGVEVAFTPITYLVVRYLKRVEHSDVYDAATDFNPFAATGTSSAD